MGMLSCFPASKLHVITKEFWAEVSGWLHAVAVLSPGKLAALAIRVVPVRVCDSDPLIV
jgi:hypothetical protein